MKNSLMLIFDSLFILFLLISLISMKSFRPSLHWIPSKFCDLLSFFVLFLISSSQCVCSSPSLYWRSIPRWGASSSSVLTMVELSSPISLLFIIGRKSLSLSPLIKLRERDGSGESQICPQIRIIESLKLMKTIFVNCVAKRFPLYRNF